MTATAFEGVWACAGITFELREDVLGLCRWYYPDGSPTSISGSTVEEARRAMMLGGAKLAKQAIEGTIRSERPRFVLANLHAIQLLLRTVVETSAISAARCGDVVNVSPTI